MGDTFFTDMTHFPPPDRPMPDGLEVAARFRDYLGAIVSACTLDPPGHVVETALSCRRRPQHRRCGGHISAKYPDEYDRIIWRCSGCDDNGYIDGWQDSAWDFSRYADLTPRNGLEQIGLFLNDGEYELLRGIMVLDAETERLLLRARYTRSGIRLAGSEADMEVLFGALASEANHEHRPHRKRRLDRLYDRVSNALPGL